MAAVLSVALDHARLRAREFQMLQRMEQAARQQGGLAVTLEHILADMAEVYRARAAEVFLASREKEESTLTSLAAWPEKEIHPQFIAPAQQALGGDDLILTSLPTKEQVVAIPLRADGLTSGVLVLSGRHTFSASQQAFLRVAARVMALTISNSQLYAKLERQAVLEERNRLAREVHDGLAQSIGFLNVKVQHVERLIGREQWEGARQALCELREGIQHIYAEVRSTIQDLRWLPEDGRGLFKGLEQFVLDFGERTGLEVSLFLEGEPDLSPRDEVHLLRIVQEALANVHKHAQAQHAWVRLHAGLQGLRLEIEDDGRGMAPTLHSQAAALSDVRGHFGLRIMRERAEAMGGQLSLHSTPGQGTRVQVTVDWPAALVAQPLTMVSESN
jgi:signal transduction histidine kinase